MVGRRRAGSWAATGPGGLSRAAADVASIGEECSQVKLSGMFRAVILPVKSLFGPVVPIALLVGFSMSLRQVWSRAVLYCYSMCTIRLKSQTRASCRAGD